MQQQQMFVMELIDQDSRVYSDLRVLFDEAVREFGPLAGPSKERVRDLLEGTSPLSMHGSVFRHESEADGQKTSIIVFPVNVRSK